jgi:hypothetical protein
MSVSPSRFLQGQQRGARHQDEARSVWQLLWCGTLGECS